MVASLSEEIFRSQIILDAVPPAASAAASQKLPTFLNFLLKWEKVGVIIL